MKFEKEIKKLIMNINIKCKDYLNFVNNFNECAGTDRKIESIIEDSKKLGKLYYERYKFFEDDEKVKKMF